MADKRRTLAGERGAGLEQAGIITRRRSEGDRRRIYLQLIPAALDVLSAVPRTTR